MTITLYNNTSDNRYITKNITAIASNIPIVLKDNTDLTAPTVIMEYSANVHNANYCYISEFGRYYYIEEKTYSQQKLYLKLRCDVLMSFKSNIINCESIAYRSANQYNNYLDDNEMTRLQYSDIYLKKFPNSLNKNLTLILVIGGA